MSCILVNFPVLWTESEKYKRHHSPTNCPQNSSNITDGKTQEIFTIPNRYYHENQYPYQKSQENAEITIYCTGYVTINSFESSFISPFPLSHPINFDIKILVPGTIFIIDLIFPQLWVIKISSIICQFKSFRFCLKCQNLG